MTYNADIHFAALIFMVGAGGLASVLEVGVAEETKAQEIDEDDTDDPAPSNELNLGNPNKFGPSLDY
jgi:hypothetical protein|tara:strand:- start:689 stop:889 length:201 start_codon:yes stop_codon:yes gene_type:complete